MTLGLGYGHTVLEPSDSLSLLEFTRAFGQTRVHEMNLSSMDVSLPHNAYLKKDLVEA